MQEQRPGTDLHRLAASLVTPRRGMLALDQPCAQVQDMLRRARIAATEEQCHALRDLVLATPGLDRLLSGVLLEPAALHAAARQPGSSPTLLGGHGRPIGVRMDDETTRAVDVNDLAAEIDRHTAHGASFACRRLVAGEGSEHAEVGHRTRLTAEWATACQRGGVVPIVECVVRSSAHLGLTEAEEAHTAAVAAAVTALDQADADPAATVLGVSPVVPGRRSSQVDASEDVARATMRSLRTAGARALTGIVFTPPLQARHLTAHLAAMQWVDPDWPIGYCLGSDLLATVAAVWRGRPDRVTAAQRELRSHFVSTTAVLRAGRNEVRRRSGQDRWGDGRAS